MPVSIAVTVVSGGGITVSPSSASVNRNDSVTWNVIGGVCTNLTISFPNKTPFNAQQLTSPGGTVEGSILGDAGTTAYGYVIAAVVDGIQYVGPPPLSPEIIVM